MSREVLINDLRAKGEEAIARLWREAREEAERFRAEEDGRLAAEHLRCDLAENEARRGVLRRRSMAARRRGEAVASRAEQELRVRLHDLAASLLAGDWLGDRRRLLKRLAAELPAGDWARILVNPQDTDIARDLFPGGEIAEDPRISSGLKAVSRDGKIVVDNTLATRLERLWPHLEPQLLQEIRQDAAAG